MPSMGEELDPWAAHAVPDLGADQIRLVTKVARMYHERGMRQPEIAAQLHISQPRVSRLLKKALAIGIVRTIVVSPRGSYAELEEEIESRYGLQEVVIADTGGETEERIILPALGAAAAVYLDATLTGGDRVGISSWSSTLLATVEAMRPRPTRTADQVVQVLGGMGVVTAQAMATRLTGRLAQLTGADAVYLPAPGLVASAATREVMVSDPMIASVHEAWERLTLLLAGIGSLEPSSLLRESGNAIAEAEAGQLRAAGAVGDVCLRFFDASGAHVVPELDDRVIGIGVDTLRAIPRRVAVAGSARKYGAIRAALLGGWVNVLITDLAVAQRLAADPLPPS
jgi:DNA-binding transcriptional regulator LsrR (DeoR family)